jgi:hypothetical protein
MLRCQMLALVHETSAAQGLQYIKSSFVPDKCSEQNYMLPLKAGISDGWCSSIVCAGEPWPQPGPHCTERCGWAYEGYALLQPWTFAFAPAYWSLNSVAHFPCVGHHKESTTSAALLPQLCKSMDFLAEANCNYLFVFCWHLCNASRALIVSLFVQCCCCLPWL